MQAFKQNTGRDLAEFWKRTLSFVRDGALTFLSIFVVGFSSSFQCASSQANPSANNKKIKKSSFGDPKIKKLFSKTPPICEVIGEGRRDFDFGLLILLSYVCEQLGVANLIL